MADELVIRALSSVLKRPLILFFKEGGLDFPAQGLTSSADFLQGDPIFVMLDQQAQQYNSLIVRNESFFEDQLQQNLKARKVGVQRNTQDVDRELAITDGRLVALRARLFGKGQHLLPATSVANQPLLITNTQFGQGK